jgi:glycosyltransferase involved in cell wall biosynthesis
MAETFAKYSYRKRFAQEREYARMFLEAVRSTAPDLVVMCNTPLLAHSMIERRLARWGVPTVFWHQDVYSRAMAAEAMKRLGLAGRPLALAVDRLERRIARRAQAVVAISENFLPVHSRWGTASERLHVIPNWAPLDEIIPRARDNDWARRHDLLDGPILLYSGTIGLKHDPNQLVALLRGIRTKITNARMVVVSEGEAADHLRNLGEEGLTVLPFQPFSDLPDVLASGDVLVTILEPEASNYSVPSKTLSYLCAGRPVLALVPEANPAHALVEKSGGLAFDPARHSSSEIAAAVVDTLIDEPALARRGQSAREFAEFQFDIQHLADRFERVFDTAASSNLSSAMIFPQRNGHLTEALDLSR